MSFVKYINSWLKDIVILFIFISIAELIMPKGNMKRYINLIIGLLIIITLISPLARLMKIDLNLEQGVFNYSKENYLEIDEFYKYQDKQIEAVYKERFRNEIIDFIEEETEYKVASIEIDLKEEEQANYEIDYLKIEIAENIEVIDKDRIRIEKISHIRVENSKDKTQKGNIIIKEEFKELRKLISKKYVLDENSIVINDNKKGNGE